MPTEAEFIFPDFRPGSNRPRRPGSMVIPATTWTVLANQYRFFAAAIDNTVQAGTML